MALKRQIRLIRPRSINTGPAAPPLSAAEKVKQSQLRYVLTHPKYKIIAGSFAEGVKMTEIASWFAREGWLDTISEKTFLVYLATFKRAHPDIVKGHVSTRSIDALVDANQPDLDEITELVRLVRLNKIRIKAAVDFEINSNGGLRLDPETNKAIEGTRVLLETLAKVRGKFGGDGSSIQHGFHSSEGADTLNKLRQDEGARDRLTGLTQQFIGALHGSATPKAKAKIRR